MEKFLAAVRNMFSVPDLRRRILLPWILAVYRLGAHIGAPGINRERLEQVWQMWLGRCLGPGPLLVGTSAPSRISCPGSNSLYHRVDHLALMTVVYPV